MAKKVQKNEKRIQVEESVDLVKTKNFRLPSIEKRMIAMIESREGKTGFKLGMINAELTYQANKKRRSVPRDE